ESRRAAAHHFIKLLAVSRSAVPVNTQSPYLSQRLKPAQGLSGVALARHLQRIERHGAGISRPFTVHGLNLSDYRRRAHFLEAVGRRRR
ncbi:hypothetical protein HY571_01865, partial [Candidatus Micrarchaeota archaeon]|nr:hypothetical protein [Candidatus Micrarchaeota archaeon]